MTYVTGQESLPPNTIVPEEESLFVPYLNRLYEDIAYSINAKNESPFTVAISNVATDIASIPTYGAFIVCVSGVASGLPTITASLSKPDANIAGNIVVFDSQAGTVAPWGGIVLTVTSTATHFRIAHNLVGITGNFSIKIIGTNEF